MTQIATVLKMNNTGMAEVQVTRKTACGHDCSKCAGCKQVVIGDTVIEVKNELNAKPGDLVVIESKSSKILTAAMI
ncbi:MAG: polyunsaturated fatty acid synthase PfaA, partial [Evtepia sp.]|nr:polyunsaturated fatty acid synthase PfaA [Evtepia sp.]